MKSEIIIYQTDEQSTRLEVRLEDETVWLTQAQMADLFQTTRNNITLHIGNIFKENELDESSVGKESLLTATDGKKYRTRLYNLDVIISVGYRVKSLRGTQFRIWANKVLKDYLLKGYAINQRFERIEDDVHYLKDKVQNMLGESSGGKESLLTAADAKKYQTKLYNLFVIISDSYRVKSLRGTQFLIWTKKVLKELDRQLFGISEQFNLKETEWFPVKSHIIISMSSTKNSYR